MSGPAQPIKFMWTFDVNKGISDMNVPGKGNGRQWVGKSATRIPTVSDTRMRTPTQAVRLVVGDLVPFSLCRVLSGEVKSRLYLLACAAPARQPDPGCSRLPARRRVRNTSRPQLRLCFRGATIMGASEATSCPTMTAPRLTTRVPRSSATTSRAQTLRSDSAGSPTILQGRRSSLQPPVRPRHLSAISSGERPWVVPTFGYVVEIDRLVSCLSRGAKHFDTTSRAAGDNVKVCSWAERGTAVTVLVWFRFR